jgi:hypothetical protein
MARQVWDWQSVSIYARMMGGDISLTMVTSTQNVGSCFHVRLIVQESEKEGIKKPINKTDGNRILKLKPGIQRIEFLLLTIKKKIVYCPTEFLELSGICDELLLRTGEKRFKP